jgi:hypothetical protein
MPSHLRSIREWWSSSESVWSGWLSPEGRLIPCPPGEHADRIERITGLDEWRAEQTGWIKLAEGEWITAFMTRPVSQAQYTAIWSWCRSTRREFPLWLET